MNILMISELYKFGGASEVMEILAKGMEENGHKVILLYGYNYENHPFSSGSYIMFGNVFLRKINNRLRYYMEKYNLRNIYAESYLNRIIKKHKIDIVHFHAMQGGFLYINAISDICKKYNIIWTIHDTWPFTGGCMYYWNCRSWKSDGCTACKDSNLQMSYKNTAVNLMRKKMSLEGKGIHFVTPSKWMQENVLQSFLKEEQIRRVANGIDLQVFKPLPNTNDLRIKYGLSANKKILMFSSGSVLNKYKGWNCLISALTQLSNHCQYELLIVGKEDSEINCLGFSVIRTGFVEQKECLNELYNAADLFIIPSLQDNFPTVALEAQAAGTPVLAFATGGISEQITPQTGWLVRSADALSLKDEIEHIFHGEDWQSKLSKKGKMARKRCEQLYDRRLMTQKYEKIYIEKAAYEKGTSFHKR